MDSVIKEEFFELARSLRDQSGTDIDSHLLFNFATINIMWSFITGKRFHRRVPADFADVENIEEVFKVFGGNNSFFAFLPYIPEWIYRRQGGNS